MLANVTLSKADFSDQSALEKKKDKTRMAQQLKSQNLAKAAFVMVNKMKQPIV